MRKKQETPGVLVTRSFLLPLPDFSPGLTLLQPPSPLVLRPPCAWSGKSSWLDLWSSWPTESIEKLRGKLSLGEFLGVSRKDTSPVSVDSLRTRKRTITLIPQHQEKAGKG